MANNDNPKRLRRADSFLGIHFDFHASDDCTEIGKDVTPEMVERIIEQVRPDYIQTDCKGHRGLTSYPTKVGNPAPGFVKDTLRIWRDVTAKHGVALFMHYSGVFDMEALKKHPSWARIDENGKRDKDNTSTFGPYVDKLFIPQMKELSDVYGVDGVWVDGECWACKGDYGKKVIEQFQAETGIKNVPKKRDDPGYFEFREFCREGFRNYLRHYVDEMHAHNPDFQVASNWAFTSQMPEPVSANVDFISGDYSLQDSVNCARFESRYIANQGKPWDLMAWGFSGKWGEGMWSTKAITQLQQEASVVLAMGGGFAAYFTQKRDGSISDWQMTLMAETAKFCRARQEVCHKAKPVPQVGLLLSTSAYYRKDGLIFAPWAGEYNALQGILNALLDSQQSVEVLSEHHLNDRIDDYPLIVVPEWDYLDPKFLDHLKSYVKRGGSLLVIGPKAVKLFETELDVKLQGEPVESRLWMEHDGWLAGVMGLVQNVELGKKASPVGRLCEGNDPKTAYQPAAAVTTYGKGKVAGVFVDLGARYRTARTTVVRDLIKSLAVELFPEPIVKVKGSHFVDVVVTRKDGKLAVNLVNTAGPHHDPSVHVYDEVPPIGPIKIKIKTGEKPSKITRHPDGASVPFTFEDGAVRLAISRLEMHDIYVIE